MNPQIFVNAYDSKKFGGNRGKDPAGASASKSGCRYCTFCNRYNHTVEFCYLKHGHPNSTKSHNSTNATNAEISDATQLLIW